MGLYNFIKIYSNNKKDIYFALVDILDTNESDNGISILMS